MENERSSNVVRLPVDWLGPRDQLVPFGPGAADPPADTAPPDDGTADRTSLRAVDFWEGELAVQDVLERPADPPPPRQRATSSRRRRRRSTVPHSSLRRPTGPSIRLPRPPARVKVPQIRAGRRVATIAAALTAAVATVGLSFGPGSSSTTQVASTNAGHPAATDLVGLASLPAHLGTRARPERLSVPLPHHAVLHSSRHPRTVRVQAKHHRGSHARVASHGYTPPASQPVPTRYVAPTTTRTQTITSQPAASQPATSSVSSTHSTPPAGPTGAGAPFAPGQLG